MKNIKLFLISFAIIAIAVGCSGGGGSSGGGAPVASKVTINAGNADAVAKGGMSNSQNMAKTGAVGAGTVGVVVEPGIPKQSIMQIALAQLKLLQSTKFPAPPAGTVGASIAPWPITFGCGAFSNTNSNSGNLDTTNGTLTVDFQDNNNDGVFGVTDAASMSFSSCKTDNPAKNGSTITTNGTMTLTVNTHNGVTTPTLSNPLSESVTMSFTSFSSVDTAPTTPETITMDGGITMSVTDDGAQTTAQMYGSSFSSTSTTDGAFTMKNFLISYSENISTTVYSFTVSMTTSCAALNGDIVITTPTPFTGTGTGNPTAGLMRIDGASNSYITITANPGGNTVTIVANDGTQTVVTKTVGWDKV